LTLTLAIMACFVDAGLTTLSSLTPIKSVSSSIRPSERAVRTLCSMRLTSLYRRFLEADGLGFEGDDEGVAVDADDDDAAAAVGRGMEEVVGDFCGTKSNASSRVFSSCSNLQWVAKTEHFLHTQSFKISRRV
jgi:hypothetical protein